MAAESNGKPKGSSTTMNGQPASTTSSGRRPSRKSSSKRKGTVLGWLMDKALKLTVWYCIITLAVRCPKTIPELDEKSSRICKPAIQARDAVYPYVEPYYNTYLDPYVQKAQPYVDQWNEKVYRPGKVTYEQYGAPRVKRTQEVSQQQWEKTIKPQLEVARQQAGKQYDALLAPHVKKVQDVVQPYYDQVSTSAYDIWELELRPVYQNTAPYAQKMYEQGQHFAVNTALPQAQYAGNTVWVFWTRQVWPKIRVLYGENVEPQLNRITERLGRYKDGRKLQAEIKSMESESKASEASSMAQSVASSLSSSAASPTVSASKEPEPSISPVEQFREDLKSWETVCARAVNEGADDLKERIQEIASRQIGSQAGGVGNSLIVQLEETVSGVLNSAKARIQSVVSNLSEDASDKDLDDAHEQLSHAIRNAGQNVKGRAQAVRDWHDGYKNELDTLIGKATQSTLETIDNIRELRLSEIGRRYSDKEIPHKEWSKYNDLKKATQSWRDDVLKVAEEHEDVKQARGAGEEVQSRGMAVAERAAKELGRLKDVAKWKVEAGDATDDFSTKVIPARAARVKQQVADKVEEASEAIVGSEQGTVESATSTASEQAESVASEVSNSVNSVSSKASEAVAGKETTAAAVPASEAADSIASALSAAEPSTPSSVESVVSDISESAASAASSASSAVAGTPSGGSDSATDSASSAIIGTESSVTDSATDSALSISKSLSPKAASILAAGKAKKEAASDSASSVSGEAAATYAAAADNVQETLGNVVDDASSRVSSVSSVASEQASEASEKASSKVFLGANAQVLVEARDPILDGAVDDDMSYSERLQSVLDGAAEQASALTQAVADAMRPSTTAEGVVESASSLASEQYESAIAAASSVLFGPQKDAVEQGTEAAKAQYESAVTA